MSTIEKGKNNDLENEDSNVMKERGIFFKIMKLHHHNAIFIIAMVLAFITGCVPIIMNTLLGDMVNLFTGADFKSKAKTIIFQLLGFAIGYMALLFSSNLLAFLATPHFINDIREALFKSMMAADMEFFDASQTGTLMGRLTNDVTLCSEIYIAKFFMAIQNIAEAVSGIIYGIIVSWRVTLSIIVAYPLAALIFWACEKWIDRLWEEYNQSSTNASEKATEVISSFRTVKAFDQENFEVGQFQNSLNLTTKVYNKTSYIAGIKDGSIELILNSVVMIIWYFSSWIIQKRPQWKMEVGDLMILQMSLIFAVIGISQVLTIADDFKKAAVSGKTILEVTRIEPKIKKHEGNTIETAIRGKVEFRDVCFKYKTMEKYAIDHLSFVIQPGETVAFVGESGCGKSTTLQLLQRFYDIESGEILLDDVDIRTLSPKFIRDQISIVPQSPILFSLSIKDNIAYASPEATDAEIASAARVGNAHNFVMELPDNYQTPVGPTSLSGGQKQRICISRAILKKSPILLLDEATAALDTESEQLVQQSIEHVRHGKTAIMVAHRLATVINADRILVFKEGKVVETGNHQELLELNGIYANLVKFQLQ